MRLLLDTHALIWFISNDPQLSSRARTAIEAKDAAVFVSHASLWEIAIKLNIGKLQLKDSFNKVFPIELERNNLGILPIQLPHLAAVAVLPGHHRDPFDRLIIAQARADALTIVTCDPQFPPYGVPTLW